MTGRHIQLIVQELDECEALIDCARNHILNDQGPYAETALAVLHQHTERLRGALDNEGAIGLICSELEARSKRKKRAA